MAEYEEIIEGTDSETNVGWGIYPLDSVFVRSETRTVREVYARITKDRYVLNPDFQRDFVWSPEKQSRLIESCLMRIPLPVFYVAEAPDGKIIVVDGLQRLTTFCMFLENKFKLEFPQDEDQNPIISGKVLNGKDFQNLDEQLRERIEDTQLILYILDQKAPVQAKLDIFERVNSGQPLTRQQMRNALYNGPATRWLKKASQLPSFLSATQKMLNPKEMIDREAINRFCAFKVLGYETYDGNMDSYLVKALEKMNEMPEKELDNLFTSFDQSMQTNLYLFGRHAFRKSLIAFHSNENRTPFNMCLFEICSVLFSEKKCDHPVDEEIIKEKFRNLFENEIFRKSISSATSKSINIKRRFEAIYNLFEGVGVC